MPHPCRVTLTIPNGQTVSNEFKGTMAKVAFGASIDAAIHAPAVLPETVTVQVAPIDAPQAADYRALQISGADVTLTAAKTKQISPGLGGCEALRLSAGVAVAADRVCELVVQVEEGTGGSL